MKGIVFNLLETVVSAQFGDDAWDDILDAAGASGSYTSLGSYPDADMMKLVSVAASKMNKTPNEVLRWFGRAAMPVLAERYPVFFKPHTSTRPFVISVNEIIHPEVRKVYPGADVPVFDFKEGADGSLMMGYQSKRKLCALAEGFVEGAADFFGERAEFDHQSCMHHGAQKCVIRISFVAVGARADADRICA